VDDVLVLVVELEIDIPEEALVDDEPPEPLPPLPLLLPESS
jgi:hypothetical protein